MWDDGEDCYCSMLKIEIVVVILRRLLLLRVWLLYREDCYCYMLNIVIVKIVVVISRRLLLL
jgi:hypothetical protein